MHPMFKELFIATDADDLAAEEDRQRRMRRSRRVRPAMIIRPAPHRENRPRPLPAARQPLPPADLRPPPDPEYDNQNPDGVRCLPPHRSPSPR